MRINWKIHEVELETLISQGFTYKELGLRFNVSKQRIYEVIRRHFKGALKVYKDREAQHLAIRKRKFSIKKSYAKKHNIEFNLCFEDIQWPEKCPILGCILDHTSSGYSPNKASFDRVDPTKGYITGNVQIISHRANSFKGNATLEELRHLVRYLEMLQTC